jgi:hypothetical protein
MISGEIPGKFGQACPFFPDCPDVAAYLQDPNKPHFYSFIIDPKRCRFFQIASMSHHLQIHAQYAQGRLQFDSLL